MKAEDGEPAGWKRPLAYGLLLAGGLATLFNGDIGRGLNISTAIVQFAALGLLLGGAVLFFSVRQRADRAASYREVFTRDPARPPSESSQESRPDN